jgi:hypothetical protein
MAGVDGAQHIPLFAPAGADMKITTGMVRAKDFIGFFHCLLHYL